MDGVDENSFFQQVPQPVHQISRLLNPLYPSQIKGLNRLDQPHVGCPEFNVHPFGKGEIVRIICGREVVLYGNLSGTQV